jgi:hypothetical protein
MNTAQKTLLSIAIVLTIFSTLILPRYLTHREDLALTPDSVYYALSAQRAAEGSWSETWSAIWMPLVSWVSALWIRIGANPKTAVLITNYFSVLVALAIFAYAVRRQAGAALWGALLFACDPMLHSETISAGSDALFLLLSLLVFLLMQEFHTFRSCSIKGTALFLLSGLLTLCRVPGIAVSVFVAVILWTRSIHQPWLYKHALTFTAGFICILAALSWFFHLRIGVFLPSPTFALNGFYLAVDWLSIDPQGWCRLYDGHNTLLGDLQNLHPGATLPSPPTVAWERVVTYRVSRLAAYLKYWGQVVPFPILCLAVLGFWNDFRAHRSQSATDFSGSAPQPLDHLNPWISIGFVITSTSGMIFSKLLPRYFLPALPVFYLYATRAILMLKDRLGSTRAWGVYWGSLAVSLYLSTISSGVWRLGLEERGPISAGQHIFEKHGAGKKIIAQTGYSSIIASRGRWYIAPCASLENIKRYIAEKQIEYWIVDDNGRTDRAIIDALAADGLVTLEWKQQSQSVYRIHNITRPQLDAPRLHSS